MSASPCPPDPRSPARSGLAGPRVEASKALVLRYFEMWNTGEGATADELLGPTYVEHAHPDFLGPAAVRSLAPRLHALYPGLVVRAEIVAADAEFVAVRTRLEPGDADGHPDGPRRGMALFRVADGRLAEQWSWYAPVRKERAA
ncbi:MAG TPA: nuclear transport factor 2 family protein [Polyangiaceae bacterium]|jgi:predicted SnoaL-like aldol condensation-catalyzing enzyme